MSTSLVFIDSRIADIDSRLAAMPLGAEVVIVNGDSDGLDQIAAGLRGRSGIDAVHIVSHGGSGRMVLGSGLIDSTTLAANSSLLDAIGKSLAPDGDILLYSCNLAAGDAGVRFIGSLAQATGADVAASTDATGGIASGGDWVLETRIGMIESATLDVPNFGATLAANTAPSFDAGDGKITTAIGTGDDLGFSVAVQADGRILVAGYSWNGSNSDFALVRYNTGGSLDTTFDSDGKLTTDFGAGYDSGHSVTVQADGKILVAGYSNGDFALARYNADGRLDTTFDADGKVATDFGSSSDDGYSVTVQTDGKILVAGTSRNAGTYDFALARYNADGSLDTTFDADGKLITDFGGGDDSGQSVVVQTDGKILVWGYGAYALELDLARYNVDGSLDTMFDADGKVTADKNGGNVAVQADGKRLFASSNSNGSNFDFELTRYNTNGSLDTTFDSDGKLTTAIGGGNDLANSVTVQGDGKILMAGHSFNGSNDDFALVRYNADGSLDATFGSDGKLTTDFGSSYDYGSSITVQADGKILVAGQSWNGSNYDFALARYNANGSLDTTFDADGKLITDFAANNDNGYSITVQADGKILVAGASYNGSNNDFALVRYNADGSLDTTFDSDGKLTTDFAASNDYGYSVSVQADGKVVVRGVSQNGSTYDLALARYNADGSLDTTFDSDGKFTVDTSGENVAMQADGKSLNASSNWNGSNYDFELRRYNTNGSLDTHFDSSFASTLDAAVAYTTGTAAVVLDGNVQVYDPNLAAAGNYAGAILTLVRQGGANAGDVFSGSGTLALSGGQVLVSGVNIGSYTQAGGQLDINFTGNATQARVDTALQSLAYSYTASTAGNVVVNWIFSDGNTGAQGTGGAWAVTGSSTVNVSIGVNAAPSFASTLDATISYTTGTAAVVLDSNVRIHDTNLAVAGNYAGATLTLARQGGANAGDVFSGSGALALSGGQVLVSGVNIGTYTQSGGQLAIAFTGNATQARIDMALQSLAYSYTGGSAGAVTIAWTFSDGNTGAQGTGGALSVTGSTTVNVSLVANTAPSFDLADGTLTTPIGSGDDGGRSVTVQADGRILVAGYSWNGNNAAFALVRYSADGSLDTTFDTDGKLTTDIGSGNDGGNSVTVQADGKILVAGYSYNGSNNDFALARYNADGSLDTTFDSDGKLTTDFGSGSDYGNSVTVQADGKILVAGSSNGDFALARYNADGSLDSTFDTDGKLITEVGTGNDSGSSVTVEADGKIFVSGQSWNGSNYDFALARYNADGSLDTTFDSDGKFTVHKLWEYVTVQADGKSLLASGNWNGSNNDFALTRYNTDGSLDTTFDSDGTLTTAIGAGDDGGNSVTVQADGKILVAGYSANGGISDFALVRYNADGSLDTTFDADGKLTTDFGAGYDSGNSVTVQADGKILVAGSSNGDFALARYNADGSLDTTFNADGKLTTDFGASYDSGNSVTVQADGKILVAGSSYNGSNNDFALARYNADGSLDATFDADGKLTTAIGAGDDYGYSVTVRADGKIVVAGHSRNGSNYDVTLVRYNADGSLDTTFDGDGKFIERHSDSYVQADGKHLHASYHWNGSNSDFALTRYNTNGSPDTSFDSTFASTLDAIVSFTTGNAAVRLDSDAHVYDADLAAADSYAGAGLTIRRQGGANANDVFSGSGTLSLSGGQVLVSGVDIGTYTQSGGQLDIVFTGNAAQARVDTALQSLAYSYTGNDAGAVTLAWTFSDGNTGAQGTGGALPVTGSTTVNVSIGVNAAPNFGVGDGKLVTDFGASWDSGNSVTVQADGKILVAGSSNGAFALVRYNADGRLDTTFDSDGKLTTAFGASGDEGKSVTVQADGKIFVAGYSNNGSNSEFALARYNANGSLDTTFDSDGKLTTDFGTGNDTGRSVTVQTDGKVVVAGTSGADWFSINGDFTLVRYNADGSVDTTFDSDGKLTTDFGSGFGSGNAVTVQADSKILVAGSSNGNFALARYNGDGSLDTTFDSDGKLTTDIATSSDGGNSVTVQADGKILVAGSSYNGSNGAFALVRYNADGSLDTTFDSDGKLTTDFGSGSDGGNSVTLQADGKILVAGFSYNGSNGDFALVRYNADGSLDTTFDSDGKLTTDFGSGSDYGNSVTVQADGKILVAGQSWNGSNSDFALARYNANGSLDSTFASTHAVINYTTGNAAVVLDSKVQIHDPYFAAAGNYAGTTLTLVRQGGANAGDVFSGSGTLALSGGQVLVSGVNIGTYTQSGGQLGIAFTGNATQVRIDKALQSLAYSYTGDTAGAATLAWTFSDGNTGAQGGGGPLTATRSTTVNITIAGSNVAPTAVADTALTTEDAGAVSIAVLANDTDPDAGDTKTLVSVSSARAAISGSSIIWDTGSAYQSLAAGQTATDSFSYTMRDAAGLTSSASVTVTIQGANDAPVAKDDSLALSEDGTLSATLDLLANDSDVDGGDLVALASVNGASASIGQKIAGHYGSFVVGSDGQASYVLDNSLKAVQDLKGGQSLTETLSYAVTDKAGASSSATLTVSIAGKDDAPNLGADSLIWVEGSGALQIRASDLLRDDRDPDAGDSLTLVSVGSAQSGTTLTFANGIVKYEPGTAFDALKSGEKGSDSFSYTVSDNSGNTATGTVSVTVLGTTSAASIAREGQTFQVGGHSYELVTQGLPWQGARAYAEARGGHLATLDSEVENSAVVAQVAASLKDSSAPTAADTEGKSLVWLGANNIAREGIWTWTDGTALGFNSWASGQPDNRIDKLTTTPQGQDAAGLDFASGLWSDLATTDRLAFLIEYENESGSERILGNGGGEIVLDPGGKRLMAGGKGHDTYVVEREGQAIEEKANEGEDTVVTTLASYTLGDNLERLQAHGLGAFSGTGNGLTNTLEGNTGNDTLDGGGGADRLIGGAGDDTYVVDNSGDRVIEKENEGNDGIRTILNGYSLAAITNVEKLSFSGSGAFNGGGNALGNLLAGNGGNDRLFGAAGNDTLNGGAGNDTLDGGSDVDTALVSGNRADYIFSRPDLGKILMTRKDGSEADLLSGIEQVRFADGSIGQLTLEDLLKNSASKFDDQYSGDAAADVFDGLAGNDSILGGSGNDSLTGGLGHDTLDGGSGSDQLKGGAGNDVYVVDAAAVADADPAKAVAGDVVSEALNAGIDKVQTSLVAYSLGANIENLDYLGTPVSVLDTAGKPTGTSEVQQLAFAGTGNDLANMITGGGGNDTLDGGKGADRLIGGTGDDTYLVDSYADRIVEKNGEGNDILLTTLASYTLAGIANVENLGYANGGRFAGVGNELANRIAGGVGNDTLDGGKGDDTLTGGAGNDLLKGGEGSDTAILAGNRADYVFSRPDTGKVQVARKDGTETDTLTGIEQVKFADGTTGQLALDDLLKNTASKFDDNYEGDAEANVFDGLAGNDSLVGGGGNDSLTGGLGHDSLDGGSGDDSLTGGLGNDSYVIDSLADAVGENANEGIDTIRTRLASLTLAANVEVLVYDGTGAFSGTGNELANTLTGGAGNDSLTGGAGNDLLQGGDGDDRLDGGEGADRLEGGAGDDTYIVASPADLVREIDASGNDTGGTDTLHAQAAGRYLLAQNVENFVFDATDGVVAIGNAGNNQLSGNTGNDTLVGAAGNDTLNGGAGADHLTGGLDSDVFVFSTAPANGIDTITDFRNGEDKIQLDHLIFDTLGALGGLNTEFFIEGNAALDANDYLVYDSATGTLWYDADGSGAESAQQIALLANRSALAAGDFLVG